MAMLWFVYNLADQIQSKSWFCWNQDVVFMVMHRVNQLFKLCVKTISCHSLFCFVLNFCASDWRTSMQCPSRWFSHVSVPLHSQCLFQGSVNSRPCIHLISILNYWMLPMLCCNHSCSLHCSDCIICRSFALNAHDFRDSSLWTALFAHFAFSSFKLCIILSHLSIQCGFKIANIVWLKSQGGYV